MNIFHRIRAYLYPNPLTESLNDFIARVISDRSLNVRQVCEAAVTRGGADISVAAMDHAVNIWLKEMGYQLCDAYAINAGWFTVSVHIKGSFDSPNEKFDPEKHRLVFEFHQGAQLRRELANVEVDVLGVAETGGIIAQVVDVRTGSINDLLTPNRNLRIAGEKLKVVGESSANGVFFVNQETGIRTPVETEDMVVNNPSELIVVIPELPAGEYSLEAVTQYSGNKRQFLKEPRTLTFDRTLTVT
ncbi:MAG: DUF4469 domain-containing protein [Tannerella sp.]|jgi:hypothetical protein|nr:DUF4469 domain-containing protein [Tannerella sp.]